MYYKKKPLHDLKLISDENFVFNEGYQKNNFFDGVMLYFY